MSSSQEGYIKLKAGMKMVVKHFLDECILCGQCLENCAVYLEPRFELSGYETKDIMAKVVDLLKGGPPTPEVYRMAYGCAMGCTNVCGPACPQGLDLRMVFLIAQHRLRAAGLGLPPLSYQHTPGHRYGIGHILGDLQMKASEVPWLDEISIEPEPARI